MNPLPLLIVAGEASGDALLIALVENYVAIGDDQVLRVVGSYLVSL